MYPMSTHVIHKEMSILIFSAVFSGPLSFAGNRSFLGAPGPELGTRHPEARPHQHHRQRPYQLCTGSRRPGGGSQQCTGSWGAGDPGPRIPSPGGPGQVAEVDGGVQCSSLRQHQRQRAAGGAARLALAAEAQPHVLPESHGRRAACAGRQLPVRPRLWHLRCAGSGLGYLCVNVDRGPAQPSVVLVHL